MSKIFVLLLTSLVSLHFASCVCAEDKLANVREKQTVKDGWQSKIIEPMQTAQSLLQHPEDVSRASSAQAEALAGLDAMIIEIAQRKSQCQGAQSSANQRNKPSRKKTGQPKAGQAKTGKPGKSPGKAAATSSGADLSVELAIAGDLVKDLWGKLPERQREQILQPLSEEFLPKYATEIEAYFRALADPRPNPSVSQ